MTDMKNCDIGGCDQRSVAVCPSCKHWTPSRGSKYYFCARFEATRATCDRPLTDCPTCEYYEGEIAKELGPGRPGMSGVDWEDPDDKRKYYRDYRRKKRAEAKAEEEFEV